MTLIALVLTGAGLRLVGLGELGLQVDEGFQALAVRGVLETGTPITDTGRIYFRAPLFIYLQAAFAAVVGEGPLALRLPAALFGILAIPVTYLVGRDLISRPVGLMAAAMIALSGWEIAMSRYGRFYPPFQVLFLLGVWLFYHGFLNQRRAAQVGFFIVAALAISVHDLAVTLGLLFLVVLPMRSISWQRKMLFVLLAVAVGALWRLVKMARSTIAGAMAGPTEPLVPMGYEAQALASDTWTAWLGRMIGQPLVEPSLTLWSHAWTHHPWWPIALAVLTVLGVAVSAWWATRRGRDLRAAARWARWAIVTVGLAAAMAQQGAVLAIAVLAYLAFFVRDRRQLMELPAMVLGVGGGTMLAGWCVYQWRAMQVPPGDTVLAVFRYPDVTRYLLTWLRWGWPVLMLGATIGGVWMLRRAAAETQDPPDRRAWVVLGATTLPILLMGMVYWRFSETRYFFHVFPFFVMLYAAAWMLPAAWLADRLKLSLVGHAVGLTVVGATAIVLVNDTRPDEAVFAATRGYGEMGHEARSIINWSPYSKFRQDHVSPSEALAARRGPDDRVVVVGPPHRVAIYRYYNDSLDAVIGSPDTYVVAIHRDGQYLDYLMGTVILNDVDAIRAQVSQWHREGRRVWVLADDLLWEEETRFLPPDVKGALPTMIEPVAMGRDGVSFLGQFQDVAVDAPSAADASQNN